MASAGPSRDGFAAAGAEVYLLATGPGVEAAAAAIAAETGATCHPLSCDITDAAAVRAALASIGRLDVLVNNAGLERITPLADPDPEVEETFRRIIDINVNGTFLVTRHALPKMSRGRPDHPDRLDLEPHRGAGILRLRRQQARQPRVHAGDRPRTWAEGHPRQRRLPRLGPDGGRDAVARQHGAAHRAGRSSDLLDEIVGAQVLAGLLEPADMVPLYLFLASERREGHHRAGLHARPRRGDGMTELEDRLVLVTGAYRGIGAACARAFAAGGRAGRLRRSPQAGCDARVAGRRAERLRASRAGLRRRRRALGRRDVRARSQQLSAGSTSSCTAPA